MKKRILIWLTVLCLLFCAPAKADSPLDWLASWLFGSKQKQETAVPSHAETVEALRALGIRVPDETVQEAETGLEEMLTMMAQYGFPRSEQPWDFPLLLLDILGWGDYDYDTGEWTPTSNDVYAFDAEIFDIGWMYTLFLQGIAAIVPGFDCTEVTEEIDEWDEDEIRKRAALSGGWQAEGTTKVSFVLNGHRYERALNFYGDWFNTDAIDWVNEVLTAEGFTGQIRTYFDGGQGLILFYGDDAFARQLDKIIPEPFH